MRLIDKLRNNKQQFKTVEVPVEEWGGNVRLRQWSPLDRAMLMGTSAREESSPKEKMEAMCKIVIASVVDEAGCHEFSDDDLPTLMESNALAIDKLSRAALELNGLTVASEEEVKADFTAAQGSA